MTERARADHGSAASGLHFQISKLLVASVISATAATGALIIAVLVEMPTSATPPPGPNGLPPPPPNLQPLAVFPIITGLFVLSWLSVIVVLSRDQILVRIRELQRTAVVDPTANRQQVNELLAGLRTELAADRERELHVLSERIAAMTAEFGEQRETDGYLNGMRVATSADQVEGTVRSIRRTPPQR